MTLELTNKETLLVVDDNHQNIKLLCTILNQENYNLAVALNGIDALNILKTSPVSLVLLDIMMPEMDGFEVCRQMKNDSKLKGIPIIFISALNDVENITRAYLAGGSDFLFKPVKSAELFAKIRTHLELYQYRNNRKEKQQITPLSAAKDETLQLTGRIKSALLPNEKVLRQLVPDGFILPPKPDEAEGTAFHFFKKKDLTYIVMSHAAFSPKKSAILSMLGSETLKTIALNGLPSEASKIHEYLSKLLNQSGENEQEHKSKTQIGMLICNNITKTVEVITNNIPFVYYSYQSDSYEIVTETWDKETGQMGSYLIQYAAKDRIYIFSRKSMMVAKCILKHINQNLETQKEELRKILKDEHISTLIGIEL